MRKERASLAELFHRTKTTNQECKETGAKETHHVKETHKSAMHIMKKMFKMVHSSSKGCKTSGNDVDSASTNKKLPKVGICYYRSSFTVFLNKSHGICSYHFHL